VSAGTGSSILVIGGSGFVGAHLARALAARRHHVRVLTRAPERAADLRSAGIEICQGDLADQSSLQRACEGVRLVYSAAGLTAGGGSVECWAVRPMGVGRLVDAAASEGVRRVVHCSTTGVHGSPRELPANEDSALNPPNACDAARLEGERVARETAARAGIELVVVRPSLAYGPGDYRLLRLFRGIGRRRFVLLGTGDVSVHPVYVDDLVEGLRLSGDSSHAVGRTYILAGGEVTRLGDLVQLIAREAGVKPWPVRLPVWPVYAAAAACEAAAAPFGFRPPLARHQLAIFTESHAFDISRARAELGFAPRVGLREGVRRCLEWYRGRNLV